MKITKQSNLYIIVPADATTRENYAAETLSSYLSKIFGATPEITTEADENDLAFIIGGPERNAEAAKYISEDEFRSALTGEEGIYIRAYGENRILIAGSSWNVNECERGTIYGVFEFLERYLGCSLAAYCHPDVDAGEYVTTLDEIELDDIFYVKAGCDRPYRTAIVQYSNWRGNPERELNIPFFDWLIKNRYNRILTWVSVYEKLLDMGLVDELERRGIRLSVGHHEATHLLLPVKGNQHFSEHYYETHPEFFKLLEDGSRYYNDTFAGQWVFCSRNEEAIREVAKNVCTWIDKNPAVDIIALWPNDHRDKQCLCDKCKAYSKVTNYVYFINEVVKLVKVTHPNVRFDLLVYGDLWDYPEGMKLDSSLIVDQSTWAHFGLRTMGKPDGSCIIGTDYEKNILTWKASGAEAVFYEYYMGNYGMRQRLMPAADEMQSIWRNYKEKGILGSGTQIECFNLWNNIFNFYCFARVGYDTELSLDDCIAKFTCIFGEGAEEIADIIRYLESVLDGQVRIKECGHYLMNNVDKERVYAAYERAFSLAKTARSRNNIRMHRMTFRYSDVETAEPLSTRVRTFDIVDDYEDPTGELAKLLEFDSYHVNNPGFGIDIPLRSTKTYDKSDKWYEFE